MAGRDGMRKPGRHDLVGKVDKRRAARIGVFVSVKVKRKTGLTGELKKHVVRRRLVVVEVRASPEEIDPHRHRFARKSTVNVAGRATDRPTDESAHLQVDDVARAA